MRYFIELRYNGGQFCGWQRQPNQPSVQQSIEKVLSTLLRHNIEITGAGRTDTGVHADYYVAHFESDAVFEIEKLLYKLNVMLPDGIAIDTIKEVSDDAHARFSATEREYRYYIERYKNPFTRHSTWQYYVDLDIEAMNRAAQILLSTSDFTTFAKLNSNNKSNICRVVRAEWVESSNGSKYFIIRADRFLRNMVRAIVGTLVEVGRGRYSVEQFIEIVQSRDLSRSSSGAPAQGLFLHDILYPQEIFVREK